jgi:BirA family biotin operon repressor/biotin-[acetyl-CoA-carboxylase] ligase
MTPRDEWQLDTRHVGRRVLIFDCVDSTNSRASLLADDPANEGLAVLADAQHAGRGQHGRNWLCPPGAGVLLSVLLFPPSMLRRAAVLTAWAAVSVCKAIQDTVKVAATIKWPNDVLVQNRKVCGILIEQARATIVGIGLNVNQSAQDLSAAGLPEATSLAAVAGRRFEVGEVARLLLRRLDMEYAALLQGELETLQGCWQHHLGLHGRRVTLERPDTLQQGRLVALRFHSVEVELADGNHLQLAPESILHITRQE